MVMVVEQLAERAGVGCWVEAGEGKRVRIRWVVMLRRRVRIDGRWVVLVGRV